METFIASGACMGTMNRQEEASARQRLGVRWRAKRSHRFRFGSSQPRNPPAARLFETQSARTSRALPPEGGTPYDAVPQNTGG